MAQDVLPEPKFDSILFLTHPLLRIATIAELKAAYDEVGEKRKDDLSKTLSWRMGDQDQVSLFAQSEEWMPLQKLRYRNIEAKCLVNNAVYLLWSHLDMWQVTYKRAQEAGRPVIAYQVASLVTKAPGGYFVSAIDQGATIRVRRLEVTYDPIHWPSIRPMNAMLVDRDINNFLRQQSIQLSSGDISMPLHRKIISLP